MGNWLSYTNTRLTTPNSYFFQGVSSNSPQRGTTLVLTSKRLVTSPFVGKWSCSSSTGPRQRTIHQNIGASDVDNVSFGTVILSSENAPCTTISVHGNESLFPPEDEMCVIRCDSGDEPERPRKSQKRRIIMTPRTPL